MKLKAIEMMERGVDQKEVERVLYREFKKSAADSTLSDWWVDREMLKKKLAGDGSAKAVQHPRWPELDDKLLPLLQPLEEHGVLTIEVIRNQVSNGTRRQRRSDRLHTMGEGCGTAGHWRWEGESLPVPTRRNCSS